MMRDAFSAWQSDSRVTPFICGVGGGRCGAVKMVFASEYAARQMVWGCPKCQRRQVVNARSAAWKALWHYRPRADTTSGPLPNDSTVGAQEPPRAAIQPTSSDDDSDPNGYGGDPS